MRKDIFAIKLWGGGSKGEKTLARFSDHNQRSVKDSYVGVSFKKDGESYTIYFSYNSLYQMYKKVLLSRVIKKM